MRDQPQPWGDRTVQVPPQDPWSEQPTAQVRPQSAPPAGQAGSPFSQGRASVQPSLPKTESFTAAHEPTGVGWPGSDGPVVRHPLSWHVRQLRRGGESSFAGAMFAFVCWGIWALSSEGALLSPAIVFLLILAVAAGIFALARVLGRLVLEKQLGRVRRTARGAHLVTAVFLAGVGFAYLRQTEWVVDAWNWVASLF